MKLFEVRMPHLLTLLHKEGRTIAVLMITICLLQVWSSRCHAQWVAQQLPAGAAAYDISFVDTALGWVGGDGGIYLTTDGGQTWQQKNTHPVQRIVALGRLQCLAGKYPLLYRTTNGGEQWSTIDLSALATGRSFGKFSFVDSLNGWVPAATPGSGKILHTTDGGTSWSLYSTPQYGQFNICSFVDTSTGWVTGTLNCHLYRTTDGGKTWDSLGRIGYGVVFDIGFDSRSHGYVISDGPGGMITLVWGSDGGYHWDGWMSLDVPPACDFVDSLRGWVLYYSQYASKELLLRTTNGGSSWDTTRIDSTAYNGKIYFLDAFRGWIVASGRDYLLHTSVGGTLGVNDPANVRPARWELSQNYPNPFNPYTSISFRISTRSRVTLTIFNLLGQQIAQLVDEEKMPGSYSVDWNAGKMSSGVYYYRMRSGEYSETKKMLILR